MSFVVLNKNNIEAVINNLNAHRQKEVEEIKAFIKSNPYPKPDEINNVIEALIRSGYSEKPLHAFYDQYLLKQIYADLFDEDKIMKHGKNIYKMEISGPNNPEHMKFIYRKTMFLLLHSIVKHNYECKKKNKKRFDIKVVLGWMDKIQCWWEGLDEYMYERIK